MPLRLLLPLFSLLLVLPLWADGGSNVAIKKVVIDAGHGGRDPGTVSPDGKYREKDITLSVALKLGNLIKQNFPEIKVIYTRDRDVAVALDRRSEIANKNRADLFISIHVNGVKSRAPSGSETFVMGTDKSNSNLQVTMLENSVILLEGDDYKSRYEGFNPNNPESYIIFSLLQNAHLEQSLTMASLIQTQFSNGPIKTNRGVKQAPFLVLWKTSMPSVLVELGFISNANDLKVLSNNEGQKRLAQLIFNAFKEYRKEYERNYHNEPHYRVQIFALSRELKEGSKEFKGVEGVISLKQGSLYKYSVGPYHHIEEAERALKELAKLFPQAFIVEHSN